MGYLVTVSVLGQKIEYRETFASFEPLGNGALREATRYWTQAEMNSRLVDLTGTLAVQPHFRDPPRAAVPRHHFVALLDDRARAVETPPAKARQARGARGQLAAVPPSLDGGRVIARDASPRAASSS